MFSRQNSYYKQLSVLSQRSSTSSESIPMQDIGRLERINKLKIKAKQYICLLDLFCINFKKEELDSIINVKKIFKAFLTRENHPEISEEYESLIYNLNLLRFTIEDFVIKLNVEEYPYFMDLDAFESQQDIETYNLSFFEACCNEYASDATDLLNKTLGIISLIDDEINILKDSAKSDLYIDDSVSEIQIECPDYISGSHEPTSDELLDQLYPSYNSMNHELAKIKENSNLSNEEKSFLQMDIIQKFRVFQYAIVFKYFNTLQSKVSKDLAVYPMKLRVFQLSAEFIKSQKVDAAETVLNMTKTVSAGVQLGMGEKSEFLLKLEREFFIFKPYDNGNSTIYFLQAQEGQKKLIRGKDCIVLSISREGKNEYCKIEQAIEKARVISAISPDNLKIIGDSSIDGFEVSKIMIMPYYANGSLLTLRENQDPGYHLSDQIFIDLQKYFLQMVNVMEQLDSLGLIMADFKIENLLVDDNGDLVIQDLKSLRDKSEIKTNRDITNSGVTPGFISPLLYSDKHKPASIKTFSSYIIGANIYSFLTGKVPDSKNKYPECFNFEYDVFQTRQGDFYRDLIIGLTNPDESLQLSLDEANSRVSPQDLVSHTHAATSCSF